MAKDAAVSYFVTFYHILQTKSLALVFHRDREKMEYFENTVKENTEADITSARAYHNPTPLRVRLDRALEKMEKSDKRNQENKKDKTEDS